MRVLTQNRQDDEGAGRIRSAWTFARGKAAERHTITMRPFDGAGLRALLREAGFRGIRLFPRPPVGRFTRHPRRIIAVPTWPCPLAHEAPCP